MVGNGLRLRVVSLKPTTAAGGINNRETIACYDETAIYIAPLRGSFRILPIVSRICPLGM
jgi:hypothetical protein